MTEIVHVEGFLTFMQYETAQRTSAIYPDNVRLTDYQGNKVALYPFFGLASEAGEVIDKIKKIIRDNGGSMSHEDRLAITKELGDVLWYISACAYELSIPLSIVAQQNILKLQKRKQDNKLHGSGDNR